MPNIFIDDLVVKLPSEVHNVINPRFAFNSLLCTNKTDSMRNNSLITLRELQGGAILMPFDEYGNIAVTPNHKYTLVEIETNIERPLRTPGSELAAERVSGESSSLKNVAKNNSKNNIANNSNKNDDSTVKEKPDRVSGANLTTTITQVKGKRQRNGEVINTTHQKERRDNQLQGEDSKELSNESANKKGSNKKLIVNAHNQHEHQLQRQNEREEHHYSSKNTELIRRSSQKHKQREMTVITHESNPQETFERDNDHKKSGEDKEKSNQVNVKQANQKFKEFESKRSTDNSIYTEKEQQLENLKSTQSKKKSKQVVSSQSLSSNDDAPLTTLFSTSKPSSPELHETNENVQEQAEISDINSSKSTEEAKAKEISSLELENGNNIPHVDNINAHNKAKRMQSLTTNITTEHEEAQLNHETDQKAEGTNSANVENLIDNDQGENINGVKSPSESKDAKLNKKRKCKTDESPLLELFTDATHEHSILDKRSSNSSTQLSAAASPSLKRTKSSSPEKKRKANNTASSHSPDAATAMTEFDKSSIEETKLRQSNTQMHSRKQTLSTFDVSSDSE